MKHYYFRSIENRILLALVNRNIEEKVGTSLPMEIWSQIRVRCEYELRLIEI